MWKNKKFNSAVRIGVTAFLLLALIIRIGSGNDSNPVETASQTTEQKTDEKPVEVEKVVENTETVNEVKEEVEEVTADVVEVEPVVEEEPKEELTLGQKKCFI